MKCSMKDVSKEKRRIVAGAVVLVVAALVVSLAIFETRKSPDEEGRYIHMQRQW